MRNPKISNLRQLASVTRYTLTEGRGKGLDIIDCDNGKIRFLLCESRALDIMQLWHKGENVSFVSKNGFVSEKVPFLERFEGGMLYTCGLESAGGREGYEQHGTHHLKAATVTRAECTDEGLVIEAYLRESALFGKNLVFKRRITTPYGSETLYINDTIVNEGYQEGDYCVLYHINLGYPLLDAGAIIEGEITERYPCTELAKNTLDKALVIEEANYPDETCYYLTVGKPEISLINKQKGKKFTVCYYITKNPV